MSNIASPTAAVGGGGGAVFLRAEGQTGNHVKAKLGSKLVEGSIPEGGVLQLKLPGLGLWEVETEGQDTDQRFLQEVKVYRYGITPCWALAKKAFVDCTPDEIDYISKAKLCRDFGWGIGDTRKVVLQTTEEINLQILDFDHDVKPDGETVLGLTLGMKDCFATAYRLNAGASNAGGWAGCEFRATSIPSLKNSFPPEWQKIMAKCQKLTNSGATAYRLEAAEDDLFMFSTVEVSGQSNMTIAGEGKQYPIFSDNNSRIKRRGNSAVWWWCRSASASQWTSNHVNKTFNCVSATGTLTAGGGEPYDANTAAGIALGFCVG